MWELVYSTFFLIKQFQFNLSVGQGNCVELSQYSSSLHLGVHLVPANFMLRSSPGMEWHPIQGGEEILFVASWYWNQDIISTGLMGHFTYIQTFFFLPNISKREKSFFKPVSGQPDQCLPPVSVTIWRSIFADSPLDRMLHCSIIYMNESSALPKNTTLWT